MPDKEMMMHGSRRIVGLDLGVASAPTAQVIDEQLQVIAKRRVAPTLEGFIALEEARRRPRERAIHAFGALDAGDR